jgi:hypothetical protein
MDGLIDGEILGLNDLEIEGEVLRLTEGLIETDGLTEGDTDGEIDGDRLGLMLEEIDGENDDEIDGDTLGL